MDGPPVGRGGWAAGLAGAYGRPSPDCLELAACGGAGSGGVGLGHACSRDGCRVGRSSQF